MTTPHRATPEEWAKCEEGARLWSGAFNCILELRSRIEALEAPMTELRAAIAERLGCSQSVEASRV